MVAAHRGGEGGRAAGLPDRSTPPRPSPAPAPRGRGLLRPEAGQLRDRPRAHHEDGGLGRQKLQGTDLLGESDPDHPPRPAAAARRRRRPTPPSRRRSTTTATTTRATTRSSTTRTTRRDGALGRSRCGVSELLAPPRHPAGVPGRGRPRLICATRRRGCPTARPSGSPGARVDLGGASLDGHGHGDRPLARRVPPLPRSGRGRGRRRRCGRSSRRDATEGETYPLAGEQSTSSRWSATRLLLALPLAPLCTEGCPGPAPDGFPTGPALEGGPAADRRWATLDDARGSRRARLDR